MKGSLIKLIAAAIFIPVLILIGTSGYFLYQNFNKYEQAKETLKYMELNKRLEKALVYLGQERGISSIYAVSKGNYPNSKKLIKQKRYLFSNAINDIKAFVDKNPEFYNDVRNVLNLADRLPIVRKKIDSFKENYIKTYFFNYYTVLETEIIKSIAKLQKHFPANIQKTYALKFPFERIISFSGIVRGFGSFYITADIPMSEDEYKNVLLKYYHDSNILPKVLLDSTAKNYLNNPAFKKIESNIKAIMFYIQQANMNYYINGTFEGYPIDAIDYFTLFTKRISYFQKVTKHLSDIINNDVQQIQQKATQNLIINAIIFAISIIILLIGLYILKLLKEHIKELSDLITSLTPIVGEKVEIDVGSAKGMHKAIEVVSKAINITQESIKKSQEAAKAKSLFLANMSHEIRTPLNGILGFLELLKTTETTPEQQEYISTIEQSAKNLLQIVNNILDVSKIESNKVSLEIIDFKALDEFENTVEIFATPAAQKQIEYVTDISPNMPSVLKGDVLKIKEILTNLINNAIKFTNPQGTISVKIKFNGIKDNKANLYFEVKDTGIGMSEEQKNKIFEAFAQADESVTRKYGGTGLGLTIVKSYIEMMGGKIEVESEINKGTKFYFSLDLEVKDKTPRYLPNSLNDKIFAILHSDISSLRKDVALEYFTYFGINKIGVNNSDEIKTLSQSENIDAIIIFYEETNKQAIEDIKNNTDLPLIFISSYANKQEIDKLNPETTIYDPVTPTKTYNTVTSLKTVKTTTKKIEVEETPIYKLKALIAEDNPINMKLLTTTLKNMGIEVDTAQNGLEAFNKYSMNPEKYDVIFMDAQMPIMDGIEATQEILEFEEEEGIPHTPIIAVTANVLKGDRERFLGAGMDDYISKPINMNDLKEVLEKISKHKYQNITKIKATAKEIENKEKPQTTKPIEEAKEVEKTKATESIKEEKQETSTIPVKEEKIKKHQLIVASESPFLANYLKLIINEDIKTVSNVKELFKTLSNDVLNVIITEEDFGGSNIEKLIESIKLSNPNTKFIVIGENNIENADIIIEDLNEEKIKTSLERLLNA